MAIQAYAKAQAASENSRSVEQRLFIQVTKALTTARENGRIQDIADAVLWNRQVWNALVADCANDGNRLPKEIRAGIISLGLWVWRQSMAALRDSREIEALIDVNRQIIQGLQMPRP